MKPNLSFSLPLKWPEDETLRQQMELGLIEVLARTNSLIHDTPNLRHSFASRILPLIAELQHHWRQPSTRPLELTQAIEIFGAADDAEK